MKIYRLLLLMLLGIPSFAQTHVFPATDTNNSFTGSNIFSGLFSAKNEESTWSWADQFTGATVQNQLDNCLAFATNINCFVPISMGAGSPTATVVSGKALWDFRGGALTISTNHLFNNLANYPNFAVLSNGINLATEFAATQGGGHFFGSNITGGITVPAGATDYQNNGESAFITNASTTTNAVAMYAQARCLANSTTCWGLNALVSDVAGITNAVVKHEIDTNVNNVSTTGQGLQIAGAFNVQPAANFPAFQIAKPGTNQWTAGIVVGTGATQGTGIVVQPLATGVSQGSQSISFQYTDSGNVTHGVGLSASQFGLVALTAPFQATQYFNAAMFTQNSTPAISSGFGTSPSVLTSNGTITFRINVGTGGTASAGVVEMTAVATNGYNCQVGNLTAHANNRADDTVFTTSTNHLVTVQNQTKSTGAAVAWTASDTIYGICAAY